MRQRKGIRDALAPVSEPRWLVTRDRYSVVLNRIPLRPGADLRGAMLAEHQRRVADGWVCEPIPRNCSFFFCERGLERLCVAIECFEPVSRGAGASLGAQRAPKG